MTVYVYDCLLFYCLAHETESFMKVEFMSKKKKKKVEYVFLFILQLSYYARHMNTKSKNLMEK